MKRIGLLCAGAALALTSVLAIAQDSPESLLPPGFEKPKARPASPGPGATPVVQPVPTGSAAAPSATSASNLRLPSLREIEAMSPDELDELLGLKAGGFWLGNPDRGLTAHQSTTVLFDPRTGVPVALMDGNHITTVRTAAVGAIAARRLARPDARVAAVVTGHLHRPADVALGHLRALARPVGVLRDPAADLEVVAAQRCGVVDLP